jgi:RNA polymerase sigma-70 factor (ECF subfamily)
VTRFLNGDLHAAQDVVQETLVRAWADVGRFADARHLENWCFSVARCRAVSWLRRRGPPGRRVFSMQATSSRWRIGREFEPRRRAPPARSYGSPWRPPQPGEAGADELERVRRAVARLPPRYAGVVHLHYLQGLSTQDAAELLGVARTTVKMRLYRARKHLRRELDLEEHALRASRVPRPGRLA